MKPGLSIYEPSSEPRQAPETGFSRRAVLTSAVTGLAGLGLGIGYLNSDQPSTETQSLAQKNPKRSTELKTLHTKEKEVELPLPNFENAKAQALSYADLFNQLNESRFMSLVPRKDQKDLKADLQWLRSKANKAAYFFTLDDKYMDADLKQDLLVFDGLKTKQLTEADYDIPALRDLLMSKESIDRYFNLIGALDEQMKKQPETVSPQVVRAYAANWQSILKDDEAKNDTINQKLIQVYDDIIAIIDAKGSSLSSAEIQYFQSLLSFENFSDLNTQYNERKIDDSLRTLKHILEGGKYKAPTKVATERRDLSQTKHRRNDLLTTLFEDIAA